MPTHSSVWSSKTWCFQIGTSALRVSMRARDAAADVLQPGQRGRVRGVVQRGHALATVVVAHLADEQGQPAGTVVAERVEHLGHVEGGVTDVDEAHGVTHEPECRRGPQRRGRATAGHG